MSNINKPRHGQSAVALAVLLVATVMAIFVVILLTAHLTSTQQVTQRVELAARAESIEKIYVGRAGDVGFLLRGTGPAYSGKFKRDTEARLLALNSGEMVARMDTYNFGEKDVVLVDGEWIVRIGDAEARPLPAKGETDPPSPLHAALAGGDLVAPLKAHEARHVGIVMQADHYDHAADASLRRGRFADDVVLKATSVSERQLAEFDRAPTAATLERLLGEKTEKSPLR
ncbi:MAG: hypothetical protein HY286_08710 [Planctomycetes bacterium]|nr:hypothetical protein [Planctomycetota bacterium]